MFAPCVCLMLSCLTLCSALAEQGGAEVDAKLRFLIWRPQAPSGIQVGGEGRGRAEPIDTTISVAFSDRKQLVRLREGRQTREVLYRGGADCVLTTKTEADGAVAREVGRCLLPRTGSYLILLVPKVGQQQEISFRCLPLPSGQAEFSEAGGVQFVNHTGRELRVESAGSRWLILSGQMRSVAAKERISAIHLQVYSRQKERRGDWKAEFSRAYSLGNVGSSVCLFYQMSPAGKVEVKLLSGL